jgi:hypothetical protein
MAKHLAPFILYTLLNFMCSLPSPQNRELSSRVLFAAIKSHIVILMSIWLYIPEDRNLYNHRCDNLKSYTMNEVTSLFFILHTFEDRSTSWVNT